MIDPRRRDATRVTLRARGRSWDAGLLSFIAPLGRVGAELGPWFEPHDMSW